MPVPTVPIPDDAISISVQVHAETVSVLKVTDLSGPNDTLVAVAVGDQRDSKVSLIGPLAAVHALVVEADRQLARLAQGGE